MKYRIIALRMWTDSSFLKLSPLPPSGQSLWIRLIAGDQTNAFPGLMACGRMALAEKLRWSLEDFDRHWAELVEQDMAEADWEHMVIWAKNAVTYNPPQNPNVCKAWGKAASEMPECRLTRKAIRYALQYLTENQNESFTHGFAKGIAEGFPKGLPEWFQQSLGEWLPKQETGTETDTRRPPPPPPKAKSKHPNCPQKKLRELFGKLCPRNPLPDELTESMKAKIRARWKEHSDIEWWTEYFRRVGSSRFLTGRSAAAEGKAAFVASYLWVMGPTNMDKILSGNYDDGGGGGGGNGRGKHYISRAAETAMERLASVRFAADDTEREHPLAPHPISGKLIPVPASEYAKWIAITEGDNNAAQR